MTESIRQILRRFDEVDTYEFPADFDYKHLEQRAIRVESRIQKALKEKTRFEGAVHNQDASFSIAIIFSGRERAEGGGILQPALRFSNFGGMANLGWEEFFNRSELEIIRDILADEGFIYIPSNYLEEEYDGVMAGNQDFRTWRIRYFDWI